MSKVAIKKILACPKCKNKVQIVGSKAKCPVCKLNYKISEGIWHFLIAPKNISKSSQEEYELVHQKEFVGPKDGSYEILASIARGNKTVDIACGEGQVEKLSPETVGIEFSLNALKKARKSGVKNLILADAHALPFINDSFDVAISAGSLEHFENPQKAIGEMARVSKIQVFTVHKLPDFPFAGLLFNLFSKLISLKHQPIEKPISQKSLEDMIKKSGLSIIFKGVWTLPVNYGRVVKFLPEFKNLPSCSFIISIKK